MAIETWFTPEERQFIDTRKAVRKADREEKQRVLDEQERAELWADFDSEALLAEALEAQRHARELQAAKELRKDIRNQVLIKEIDREVEQSPKK